MKMGLIISIVLVFAMLSVSGFAYNITTEGHWCHNCTDCMDAINNNTHPLNTTYLNMSISKTSGMCINNPENFTNVTFDCQGIYSIIGDFNYTHFITDSDSGDPTPDYAVYLKDKSNATIKNCMFSNLTYAILLDHVFYSTFENNTAIDSDNFNWFYATRSSDNNVFNNIIRSNNFSISSGIYTYNSTNTAIINNTIDGTYNYGIAVLSLSNPILGALSSSGNTIQNNIIVNGLYYGMYIHSTNNSISNNSISSIQNYGLQISGGAGENILTNNTLSSNKYGLSISRYYNLDRTQEVLSFYNTIDTTNTINGKPIYYYINQHNTTLTTTNAGFVGCFNCSNITLEGFSIAGNGHGVILASTDNSNITDCTVGSNYIGFYFDEYTENNTVSNCLIYQNEYQTVVDAGTNNIFLDDNTYLYDMVVPAANAWYTSFNEMSFKISNLTYGNMSCSLNLDSLTVRTNTSVKADQKTNFTYTIPEGSHFYDFSCIDRNYTQTFSFTTINTTFGIKMSLDSVCTADTQCLSGYCTAGVCSNSRTSSSYVQTSGGLPAASTTTIPLTIGPVFVPSGGLVMVIDNDTTLDLYGTKAYINDIYVIDPNNLSPISCNQTALSSYEIDVDIDDKAYVCFDRADYSDLQSITIYTIKENEWKELDEIVIKDDKICGRITSSPYMIAGFSIPATADKALESIQLASSVADSPNEKLLVDQASQAYLNCQYDTAYDLSQNVIKASSAINISEETTIITVAIISILFIGYYFKKYPIKIKKFFRKSKRKR